MYMEMVEREGIDSWGAGKEVEWRTVQWALCLSLRALWLSQELSLLPFFRAWHLHLWNILHPKEYLQHVLLWRVRTHTRSHGERQEGDWSLLVFFFFSTPDGLPNVNSFIWFILWSTHPFKMTKIILDGH